MSLIKCPDCDKDISNKATCCPHCGFPLNKVVRINKLKSHTISAKKQICNILSNAVTVMKKILESSMGVAILVTLCGIALVAFIILAIWLLEQFAQINSVTCSITIIAGVIAAHIGGYFLLYRNASKLIKAFLWCVLILEIFAGIGLVFA